MISRLLVAHAHLRWGTVQSHPGSLFARLAAANDPWQRAPLAACGGAKTGCFLEPPSGCGLALLSDDALPHDHTVTAEAKLIDSLPLLDVDAEEAQLGGGVSVRAAAEQVVRVDELARYRDASLGVTAAETPGACGDNFADTHTQGKDTMPAEFATALAASCARDGSPAVYCRPSNDVVSFSARRDARQRANGSSLSEAAQACTSVNDASDRAQARTTVAAWQRLWFPAHEAFLFRPRASLLTEIIASEMLVGVHMRAGDSLLLRWRAHAPLTAYVDAALCAAAPLVIRAGESSPLALPWSLFLASDSAEARVQLPDEIIARAAILDFDSSTGRRPCGGRLLPPPPVTVTVSTAKVLVHESRRDANVHVESWIAEMLTRSQRPSEIAGPGWSPQERADSLDAEYRKHIAQTTATLPAVSAARGLRVFALHRGSYPILHEAVASAQAALAEAVIMLSAEPAAGPAAARICAAGFTLAAALSDAAIFSKDSVIVDAFFRACGSAQAVSTSPAAQAAAASSAVASVTAGIVADVAALSASSALVGTCLSQVSRLAYELSYAAGVARLPPTALDSHLCAMAPHSQAVLAQWTAPQSSHV